MFRGASKITLDAKGRFAIPTRHRERLSDGYGGQFVMTVDRDYCLLIYPIHQWEEIEARLIKLPSLNRQARRLQRLMIGYATELEMDAQGRVLIPRELREFAQLDRHAILIGQGNKLELWDEERWNERRDTWLADEESETGSLPADLETLSL